MLQQHDLGLWILRKQKQDRAAEQQERRVAHTSSDKFGPLIRVIRSFNGDILDHMKEVLLGYGFGEGQLERDAKETVDKLYESAGDMAKLFGGKGVSIKDDVVRIGIR